jgi:uncharacterized membrane protein YsdA (DUF1294 family)/cold shock CspA family protein
MRGKGTLTAWNDEKGFGFIDPFDGSARLFIHISAFSQSRRRPEPGTVVTYTISADEKGRPRAIDAVLAGVPVTKAPAATGDGVAPSIGLAALFLAVVALGVFSTEGPLVLLPYYVAVSIVTFIAYSIDKSAAKRDDRRTPEQTLHLFSLIGGWPGGLIARHQLRHKTRKQPFRMVFWVTVVVNVAGLFWLLTSQAASELRSALGGVL